MLLLVFPPAAEDTTCGVSKNISASRNVETVLIFWGLFLLF